MADNIFDIELSADGQTYRGWVNPSDKLNNKGIPVSFHVVLNDTSFGYVSYTNAEWVVNEQRSPTMVREIGKQIEEHYNKVALCAVRF